MHEDTEQYKEGLRKALELINTLIDQITTMSNDDQQSDTQNDYNKENIYPSYQSAEANLRGRKPKPPQLNLRSSNQELKDLVQVIKKAKQNNESFSKLNIVTSSSSTFSPSLIVKKQGQDGKRNRPLGESIVLKSLNNMNESQLPPRSTRYHQDKKSPVAQSQSSFFNNNGSIENTRRSNSLMKQVLGQLHKLNQLKKGIQEEKREFINQSVLGICDLIA